MVLEQKDAERRLQLEQEREVQRLESTTSASHAPSSRTTAVPTSSVSDAGVEQEGGDQAERRVDMEVWEASRRRVETQNAKQGTGATQEEVGNAASTRAQRREQLNHRDAERERAKRAMSRSPLEDFDVSYEEGQENQQQQQQQLRPRFGRAEGPGEQWKPQDWSPTPLRRK
jgi:NADH dehydrogenase [ubiquinone] 1 alpha subcomplex assembly factor 2